MCILVIPAMLENLYLSVAKPSSANDFAVVSRLMIRSQKVVNGNSQVELVHFQGLYGV